MRAINENSHKINRKRKWVFYDMDDEEMLAFDGCFCFPFIINGQNVPEFIASTE